MTNPHEIARGLTEAQREDTWTADDERREQEYMARARQVPEIRRLRESRLLSLAFHLWCMTRDELSRQTVEGLRERKKMLDGYITDAEIAAVLETERSRVFHAQPDSKAWRIGANGRWIEQRLATPDGEGIR